MIFEYGNWKHALSALGFLSKENINEEFKDLLQLQDELQGPPSLEEAKEAGINTKLLIDTYDGWRNVKKELKNKTTKTIIPSNNKAIGIDIEIPAIVTRLLNFLAFFSLNSKKFIIHPFIKILTNI